MKLDISKVEFCRNDIKRKLKLPEKLTPELAEDIGIMVGDGNVCHYICGNFEVAVTGHMITDNVFLSKYVKQLKYNLFNLEFNFRLRPYINTCVLTTYSVGLLTFYNKAIGLPLGPKKDINIPDIIMNSNIEIKRAFLRGLADTDMTLTFRKKHKDVLYYPAIKIATSSKPLVLDVKKLVEELGFKASICCDRKTYHNKTKKTYITNELFLYGKNNLKKWVNEIGFNNPKNILRYSLWKKQGFSLPNEKIEKIMNRPRGISVSVQACSNPRHSD